MNLLAEYLSSIRQQEGISRKQLSQITGIHITHIYKIETSLRTPSIKVLGKIANALSLDQSETSLLFIAAEFRPPETYDLSNREATVISRRYQHELLERIKAIKSKGTNSPRSEVFSQQQVQYFLPRFSYLQQKPLL